MEDIGEDFDEGRHEKKKSNQTTAWVFGLVISCFILYFTSSCVTFHCPLPPFDCFPTLSPAHCVPSALSPGFLCSSGFFPPPHTRLVSASLVLPCSLCFSRFVSFFPALLFPLLIHLTCFFPPLSTCTSLVRV